MEEAYRKTKEYQVSITDPGTILIT